MFFIPELPESWDSGRNKLELTKLKLLESEEDKINLRNEIICHNLRLVVSVIKDLDNIPMEKEDMFSLGCIGLTNAVDKFKLDSGTSFSTYAVYAIRNKILNEVRKRYYHTTYESLDDTRELPNGDVVVKESFYIVSMENYKPVLEEIIDRGDISIILDYINSLPKLARDIVLSYYGIGTKQLNQVELAKLYRCSQANISHIIRSFREGVQKYACAV